MRDTKEVEDRIFEKGNEDDIEAIDTENNAASEVSNVEKSFYKPTKENSEHSVLSVRKVLQKTSTKKVDVDVEKEVLVFLIENIENLLIVALLKDNFFLEEEKEIQEIQIKRSFLRKVNLEKEHCFIGGILLYK